MFHHHMEDHVLLINDKPNKVVSNSHYNHVFLDTCQSVIIQVMNLCLCLWPILKHLLHVLIMKEHYPYMCKLFCPPFCRFEPNYYWFMQYKGSNNGDPLYVYTLFGDYPLFLNICHFWCFLLFMFFSTYLSFAIYIIFCCSAITSLCEFV